MRMMCWYGLSTTRDLCSFFTLLLVMCIIWWVTESEHCSGSRLPFTFGLFRGWAIRPKETHNWARYIQRKKCVHRIMGARSRGPSWYINWAAK